MKKAQNLQNFANAREARNLFETVITNQARRIAGMEHPSAEEMRQILPEDLRDEPGEKKDTAKTDAENETAETEANDSGEVETAETKADDSGEMDLSNPPAVMTEEDGQRETEDPDSESTLKGE